MLKITFALVVINIISCISQPKPKPKPVPIEKKEKIYPPLLWKIERKGYPKSYLFGTIHLGVRFDELDPVVLRSLNISHKLFLRPT